MEYSKRGNEAKKRSRLKEEGSPLQIERRASEDGDDLTKRVLFGLSVAGVAASLLTTIFGMFHVEVFLKAYQLPLQTYSFGSLVFSFITTLSSLGVAWLVDHMATTTARRDLIGVSGACFALCFLAPFFQWTSLPATHFVVSLSLYDAMYSFNAILVQSVVNDSHHMSDKTRVQFMASGKVTNLFASLLVARVGLSVFDTDNLRDFRRFLLFLSLMAVLLFLAGQRLIGQPSPWRSPRRDEDYRVNHLRWRRVAEDFWQHSNFLTFSMMEMLLEAQTTFMAFFLKTFVDGLLLPALGRDLCDWLLTMIQPMTQVAAILAYLPIRRLGYRRVYNLLFWFNIGFSILAIALVQYTGTDLSSYTILAFVGVYPILTGAVQSAGFDLAQADLVLERKRQHALEGRHDEPSMAGLYLGANALLCKPVEKLLPFAAAQVLHRYQESPTSLFYLLVGPPLVCSILQLLAWRRFDLTPARSQKMTEELLRWRVVKDHEVGVP